ncbi:hypothetical protein WME90_20080 [Sorangium sp. So ce375]|uniref:hypothetical protein n=1 Tax=Sorangium sp. So ce375 TaxID=3133306 RepID=UPI003F5B781C
MAKGTKDAQLDAAELLFADHGRGGTTVRMIAARAQAHVAADADHVRFDRLSWQDF